MHVVVCCLQNVLLDVDVRVNVNINAGGVGVTTSEYLPDAILYFLLFLISQALRTLVKFVCLCRA